MVQLLRAPRLVLAPLLVLSSVACNGSDSDCSAYQSTEDLGTVEDIEAEELSGLAASRDHDDLLWAHNDHGDSPRVFAIGPAGDALGQWSVPGAWAEDWEDIAMGPHPDGDSGEWVYVADIGDNDLLRDEVVVYAFPEPDPSDGGGTVTELRSIQLTYPSGPVNAEGLVVDNSTGDVYVFTKEDGRADVYRAEAPLQAGPTELEWVHELQLGGEDFGGVTGADASPDGARILLRTQDFVLEFLSTPSGGLASALDATACAAPTVVGERGEAVAATDQGYYLVGEGVGAALHRVLME